MSAVGFETRSCFDLDTDQPEYVVAEVFKTHQSLHSSEGPLLRLGEFQQQAITGWLGHPLPVIAKLA